ncbi:Heat shock protein SSC1, mitochondrial [Lentibacillus sp. JNUCC-1]|uniref:Hsp70 family protein n=1 Tax=Lentibacillus sp. JNUCC-1 TaxID=2654513 RepID=UPI0012E8D817|nr:Hsp70 family protein [Lentibacillus sp. JNUCC-1]MUV37103.1 Heat shock protein SSC1, mitochondrial [Lentibacillus sp. JNUCC-1]
MTQDATTNQSFRPIIGIDLGTTNSAAAYIHNQNPAMLEMNNASFMLPSVVLRDPNGQVIVGDDARSALVAMPQYTKSAVKREMGQDTRIELGNQSYRPEEISAMILKEIKKQVESQLSEGEIEAVITVPAYFTNQQRQATKEAGELAGFVVERIINEPTAAALAYGIQNMKNDGHILVYDLGGGTFDVSVVELMDGILEVKASAGNHRLGGEDFDWALVDWFAEKVIDEHQIDPREEPRAKARLKEEAEHVKKQLSFKEAVDVSIPVATVSGNRPIGLETTITQEQFVHLIKPFLAETQYNLEYVLEEAGLARADIDDVILVGGSTRIPNVQKLVTDFFGKTPHSEINPDEAVALGAAVQAGIKAGTLQDSGLIITDVAPFSMGVAVAGEIERELVPGQFHAIIDRNTTIPVTRTHTFSTTFDHQTAVTVEIYQGENDWVTDNYFLNEFSLEGLPAKPAGHEAVDITFRYNINGILEVTAKNASSGNEMTVTIEDAIDRSSDDAFADSLANIEAAYGQGADNTQQLDHWSEIDVTDAMESHADLLKEARDWKDRLQEAFNSNVDNDQSASLQDVINQLDAAIQSKNAITLNDAIENAIDLAINLEL